MLKELKFVQGSVAKKELIPTLTHFIIEDGKVRGFNGTLALCSPIALNITCKPKAADMVAAINNCTDTVQLSLTGAGRLSIKSGKYKALINCVEGDTAHVNPEGDVVQLNGAALLEALKALEPFIGDDASRPFTNGVLLDAQSAFATNNVILAQYWIGVDFPVVNIPRSAVREMLRIDEPPTHAQYVPGANITFHYTDGRWIRTQLLSTNWPLEVFNKTLSMENVQRPIPPELFDGIKVLKGSVNKMGQIHFKPGCISTDDNVEVAEATYEVEGLPEQGIYNWEMLSMLKGVAHTCDFTMWPKACLFMGTNLRGAIVGHRPPAAP